MVVDTLSKPTLDIDALKAKMQGKRGLSKEMRTKLLSSLQSNRDLKVVKSKAVLNLNFYAQFIKDHKLNENKDKKDDNEYYNFFKKLKKYGLVHKTSALFPKQLSIVSINPNIASLHRVSLSHLDAYLDAKDKLFTHISSADTEEKIEQLYIYLRLFNKQTLKPNELKRIRVSDVIFVNDDKAIIYLERDNIISNTISPYHLITILDYEVITILKDVCIEKTKNLFFIDEHEKALQKFKKNYFDTLSISGIHMTGMNLELLHNSPIHTALATTRNTTSADTLSDINALHPNCVPEHLMNMEAKRVLHALSRPEVEETILESDAELFSIEQFTKLQELLRTKTSSEFRSGVTVTKNELEKYIKDKHVSQHIKLIASYILYLLKRYEKKQKMAASTVKNYIGLLNKHLFHRVEDLSNVQTHEINEILVSLERLRYKHKSIRKIRALVRSFFDMSNANHKLENINISSYPKSLILDTEIDDILTYIDTSISSTAQRKGTRYQFNILQAQALILLGFYTGLRKNELRSRLLRDVYIHDDTICIHVNKNGLKKLDMSLKTSNAKRRVCTEIKNKIHLAIIKKFLKLRQSLKIKSPFVFLRISKNNTIRSKAIDESVFDELTEILQSMTGRYVSFHSLRHSYATYEMKKILNATADDPYAVMDLSLKMGHESPETTLKVYTHRSVLDLRGV